MNKAFVKVIHRWSFKNKLIVKQIYLEVLVIVIYSLIISVFFTSTIDPISSRNGFSIIISSVLIKNWNSSNLCFFNYFFKLKVLRKNGSIFWPIWVLFFNSLIVKIENINLLSNLYVIRFTISLRKVVLLVKVNCSIYLIGIARVIAGRRNVPFH